MEPQKELIKKKTEPWSQGKYILKVESRLEDLAGNNLPGHSIAMQKAIARKVLRCSAQKNSRFINSKFRSL